MSSFFTSSSSSSSSLANSRALAAKKTIRAKLVAAIKDLQSDPTVVASEEIENRDVSNALCAALEAMFIHGTKHSFFVRLNSTLLTGATAGTASGSLGGSSSGKKIPATNFWLFVMVYTHQDTIRRLEQLGQISTDVGRCRAWLRLALNDGLLGSYLTAIVKDRNTARGHYERSAFMRDAECLEIIAKYVMGIEVFKFNLALNSSILNRWQTPPLVMAGLWIPDNVEEEAPVEAVDVVSQMEAEEQLAAMNAASSSNVNIRPLLTHDGFFSRGLLNEDAALKLILNSSSPFASSVITATSSSTTNSSLVGSPPAAKFDGNHLEVLSSERRRKRKKHRKAGKRVVRIQENEDSSQQEITCETVGNSACDGNAPREKEVRDRKMEKHNKVVVGSNGEKADIQVQPGKAKLEREAEYEKVEGVFVADLSHNESLEVEEEEEKARYNSEDSSSKLNSSSQLESSFSTEESIYARAEDPSADPSAQSSVRVCPEAVEQLIEEWQEYGRQKRSSPSAPSTPKTSNMYDVAQKPPQQVVSTSSLLVTAARKVASETLDIALPYLSGFIDSWNPFGSGRYFDTPPVSDANCDDLSLGFSLQPDISIGTLNVDDSQRMIALFDKVVREVGLDLQNYECDGCSKAIGTIFGPAKVCSYTKRYYCEECHRDETTVIPVRVVYNWDFRRFRVCHKAKLFLDSINIEPIIDANTFNASLFEFAPDLDLVFTLRKKLSYVSAYLATCRNSEVNQRFVKMLYPREYMFGDVSKFAIKDFEDIKSGQLITLLKQALKFGEDHVLGCLLCSGKGFICEVCRDEKPVYPFHLESISQCQKCFTVFHLECSVSLKACSKCERIEARNLDWHVNNSRRQREIPLSSS